MGQLCTPCRAKHGRGHVPEARFRYAKLLRKKRRGCKRKAGGRHDHNEPPEVDVGGVDDGEAAA